MDDYSVTSLYESKNEWASRLVNILTPLIQEGIRSIFDEAVKLCVGNKEQDKYLMTFQNLLSRVPKWNPNIIKEETARIKERSTCGYLEDLITCVHIIHLKCMTVMRVGNKQKKVDIKIPQLADFIHKIYVNTARKVYSNVYIFERGIQPLHTQRNNREFEIIVKECIYNTIRDNIPVEELIKMYLEDTIEDVVEVTENEEVIQQEPIHSEEDANLSARRRQHHGSTRRRRHRDRVGGSDEQDGGSTNGVNTSDNTASTTIDQLDFVGELNGTSAILSNSSLETDNNTSDTTNVYDNNVVKSGGGGGGGGISFGENQIRTFETDASERKNEYMTHNDDADDADDDADGDSGRIKIGGDIRLDTLDIHTLNDIQEINAPPLLDDIEVLA
jgi:hypothetical protein